MKIGSNSFLDFLHLKSFCFFSLARKTIEHFSHHIKCTSTFHFDDFSLQSFTFKVTDELRNVVITHFDVINFFLSFFLACKMHKMLSKSKVYHVFTPSKCFVEVRKARRKMKTICLLNEIFSEWGMCEAGTVKGMRYKKICNKNSKFDLTK